MTEGLVIENLSAGYGKRPVIAGLTLPPLPVGSVMVLTGPNGAGKSTLLRALAGLLPAKGGAVLGGRDLLSIDPGKRARTVGFMPQSLVDSVGLSVLDAVMTALKVSEPELSLDNCRRRALTALKRLGIVKLGMSVLGQLSGGQRQIASMAQTIVTDPRLLLLDEPVSALDLRHQFHVMRTVRSLAVEGRIVVMVLHDLEMASRWADQIVVMRGGELFAAGAPKDVLTIRMLREVYGVNARIAENGEGISQIVIEDIDTEAGEGIRL